MAVKQPRHQHTTHDSASTYNEFEVRVTAVGAKMARCAHGVGKVRETNRTAKAIAFAGGVVTLKRGVLTFAGHNETVQTASGEFDCETRCRIFQL